jgi:hypothetical protein
MKKNEYAKTIIKTERIVGELCLYTMVFVAVALVSALCR